MLELESSVHDEDKRLNHIVLLARVSSWSYT
jgi:hypothetical protein